MTLSRETKNTFRFDSTDERLPCLYVSKAAFGESTPTEITVSVAV